MRVLTDLERANVAFLVSNDVSHGLFEPTETGLGKSILDATEEFREFLEENAIHDYRAQAQGPDDKVQIDANLLVDGRRIVAATASLYRPVTKKGDPRIWFGRLKELVEPNEVVAVVWKANRFWLLNTSRVAFETLLGEPGPVRELLQPFVDKKTNAVDKLLDLLRGISAKGFIPAPVVGSTAVGRLLESELGIAINSSRAPDFEGIEIKSSRKSTNRTTLFAKTPDWANSPYKNSRALLDAFGYERGDVRKLSCTVSGRIVNSQGLSLEVDDSQDLLQVIHGATDKTRVVQWDMDVLRYSLANKHNETFWVKAETREIDGWEHIRYTGVQHTKKPIVHQLAALLADGNVTVDFLIREYGDKGYLFKVLPKNLPKLFPPAASYALAHTDRVSAPRVLIDPLWVS